MSTQQLALQVVLQLAAILLACRAVGRLMAAVGQPRVIGEMIAGILLGPSLLGVLAPSLQAALFPRESLAVISAIGQIGVVLYMFVVGSQLHTGFVRHAFGGALTISVAGVALPFVLGASLAWVLHGDGRFFAAGLSNWQGMLYLGAAMSVTAFPVLARIIQDRGIGGTVLGSLTLAAGASNDVVAWLMLGVVLVSVDHTFDLAGFLGAHAIFASFLIGAAMPRGVFTTALVRRIEPVTSLMLVPFFFAFSGLSTRLSLLWSVDLVWLSLLAIVLASIGKVAACWAAARWAGMPNRDALAIGALMNARGLMELIILNIGLERGLITPTLFTVMVLMTLATTLAAGPAFQWAWRGSKEVADLAAVRVH